MSNFQTTGYLTKPASGEGPGVLVLHAWRGLNDTVNAFCERLAWERTAPFLRDAFC
jgi:carboxymethylenebutenolidase